MRRVVIFGPGGAGKTTTGRRLSAIIDVPFIELDKNFWDGSLRPKQRHEWVELQRLLLAEDAWILDGELGPYDAPEVRIAAADTIIVLDLPRWLCLWRSLRRSRERLDYWRWVWSWRRQFKPKLMAMIEQQDSGAEVYVLASQADVEDFLRERRR